MNNVSTFLKENKIIVIAAGVLILIFIVVFAISSLRTTNPQPVPTEEANNVTETSPAPQQAVAQLPDNSNVEWLKALHTNYTINYLSSWTPETRNVTGGGSEAYFRPKLLLDGDVLPALHIEVSPKSTGPSINERIATLASFKLQQASTTFHDVPATTLDGILFEPVPNDPKRKGVYKKYIFFERGDLTYTITYAYYVVAENTTMANYYQNLFEAMLESFSFR